MINRLLIAIIAVSLIIAASSLRRGHEWGDDFASYIMQAESIINGRTHEFVEHNSFTIYESTSRLGPVAYPWGYPLILTPSYLIKGIHPLTLKLPGLLFYAGFLICLYLIMNRRLTQTESLLITSLFAFNPLLIQFLNQILSDIPFLFFSTLSLLLLTKENKRGPFDFILLGVSIFLTAFIRTTGILLLVVFLILEFISFIEKRQDKVVTRQIIRDVVATCSIFLVLWILNILLFPGGSESYFEQYADLSMDMVTKATVGYFRVFRLFFGETTSWKFPYYFLVTFFLIGAWHKRRDELTFILFFIIWMLVHITWPSWQGPRFIFPLLPIFIYFMFVGMKFVLEKLPQRLAKPGRVGLYGFWSLLLVLFLFTSSANAINNLQNDRAINGPFDTYSKEVYDYIKKETPAESVVIFFKPRVMRLMTDRDSFMSTECDRMLKGDYLVLSKKVGSNQQIPPEEIGVCNLPLEQVLSNNRFIVYQIQK